MPLLVERTVVVFDLDDTLYRESDFVRSGMQHVMGVVATLGMADGNEMQKLFECCGDASNFLDRLCNEFKFNEEQKHELVWLYRNHLPNIHLDAQTQVTVSWFNRNARGIAVITDGRSITQRQKLQSLGLGNLKCFVSQETGAMKPSPLAFLAVERQWPDASYVYVGDNLQKDFIAPNARGWITIGLKNNGNNIHTNPVATSDDETLAMAPWVWVDSLAELPSMLFGIPEIETAYNRRTKTT
jgi:putative hydrolase of the HAD superfamily